MADDPDPNDLQTRLSAALTSVDAAGQPPADLIDQLGGWSAVAVLAPTLVDNGLLAPLTALACRHADLNGAEADATEAANALIDAITATTDPALFGQGLDDLCNNAALLALAGTRLAEAVVALASAPEPSPETPANTALRHADALEAYVRLTLAGYGSKNRLFTVFEDIKQPQQRRYAQAAIRSISTAFDHWDLDDNLVEAIDVLAGAAAPRGGTKIPGTSAEWSHQQTVEVAVDAAWASSNIELVRALRSPDIGQTLTHLHQARDALATAAADEAAADAAVLDSLLKVLSDFLTGAASGDNSWAVDVAAVTELQGLVAQYNVGAYGLHHWAGDRKAVVLAGWGRLAKDLAFLRDQLDRESLYNAAVVLDDVLEIYTAARAVDVVTRDTDLDGVRRMVQPAIAGGFAARAGLFRHLEDHIFDLHIRATDPAAPSHDRATEMLPVAEAVLGAAREQLTLGDQSPGKDVGAQAATLPPQLAELIGKNGTAADTLASTLDADTLAKLEGALTDRKGGRSVVPHIAITRACQNVRQALATCPDYEGDVKVQVDQLIDLLVRFLHLRLQLESKYKPYLYKDDADENDLHMDLIDYLGGQDLAGYAQIEVTNIAGGRADIQVSYGPFHLYLELKADSTRVPPAKKKAYIQQAVAYQGADVQISFLVVLRIAPSDETGALPHLSTLVTHTTVTVGNGTEPRHVVMIEVPGNRKTPSALR